MTHVASMAGHGLDRATAAIEIEGLTKRFVHRRSWGAMLRAPLSRDTRTALDGVELRVNAGEFVSLLGPNGAGKTTLFKILSTLIVADAGRAMVDGIDVAQQPSLARQVLAPVIADERSLHWRLTAHENLRLFAALHGVRRPERRIAELVALVGLEATGQQLVGTYSSGMRQRLLIARALLAKPRILLLDEPTRSLDPLSARTLRTFLREELAQQQGCTILLATHNAEEAFGLCDRVVVLHQGRVLASGPADVLTAEVGDAVYHVWTRDATHPVWRTVAARGAVRVREAMPNDDGWSRVELEVPGGLDQAARVLDLLTCAAVPIARFERRPLSLADLLDRIVARAGRASDA
jgi:ABC-2 type transport system ATP-binding protein